MSDDPSIVITIRTVFEYGPIAVDSLINDYKQKSYANHVECKFNPINHTFVLEGDRRHAEAAYTGFMELIRKAIDTETSKRRTPKEYTPIHRSRLTKLNSPAVEWSEREDEPRDSYKKQNDIVSSRDPRYIIQNPSTLADTTSNYSYIEYWEPRITAADFSLMLHLHDGHSLTNKIANVCHCAVFPDWEKRNVKIGANSRPTIEKVLKKLRKIEELFKRGFEPISVILVHPEGKKKFEFKLVPLPKQSELQRTTLFYDKSKWQTYGADKMFLIRLLEYDPDLDRFLPCDVAIAPIWAAFTRSASAPRDWAEYIFDSHGHQDMSPTNVSKRLVSKNVPESPDLSSLNPEDLVGQYNTPGGAAVQALMENVPVPRPARQTQHWVDGGFELGDRPENVDLDRRASKRSMTGARRVPRVRAGREVRLEEQEESPKEVGTKASVISSENLEEPAALDRHVETEDETEGETEGDTSPNAHSVISHISSLPERHLGTGIGKVVNMYGSFVEKEQTGAVTTRTIRQPRVRKSKANTEASDKEGISEADTRDIRSTMRQKAHSHRGLFDGQDESKRLKESNSLKFYDTISKSFDHIRSWRGHVTFEASLGRVILADVPKSLSKSSIDWTEWWQSLTKAPEIKTIFTDIMTTEFFDMEFISDLKMSKAEMLFSPDYIKKTVTYEFHCKYKGKNYIMEVNARTFDVTIYGDQQAFGSVYWAHPLRSWDARFALVGREIIDNETPVFKNLFESLWIPGDSDIPEVSFLVRGKDFSVDRVIVKRETRRPCIIKKITEEQDIDLVCKEIMEMIIRRSKRVPEQYKAVAHDRLHMVFSGMLHYSFALIPTKIEKALQENTDLEIGEEVLWTTDTLIGKYNEGESNIFRGLESLVFTMLKRTDDIGFNNNNGPDEMEFA
ncbi:hypothetical protein DFP73DRAFT_539236 [Morchella snyderi]|nr:hypothetical protein DFP73DRAFT_539236 [Morchella snyderi]